MIRTFVTHGMIGLFSASLTGTGIYLARSNAPEGLAYLAKCTAQVALPFFGLAAAQKIQTNYSLDQGAILAGVISGGFGGFFPQEALKLALYTIVTIGTIGCLLKKVQI